MAKSNIKISLKKLLIIKHVVIIYVLRIGMKKHKLLIGFRFRNMIEVYWVGPKKRYPFFKVDKINLGEYYA